MFELEKKFNLITSNVPPPTSFPASIPEDIDAVEDFKTARRKIVDILEVGSKAIQELGSMASQTTTETEPYEVLSGMVKNVSEVASTLLKLHKQIEELTKVPPPSNEKNSNVVYFVGSPLDLNMALKQIEKK